MNTKLTKKQATQAIKKRNQLKKQLAAAEKRLFKDSIGNFEANQKKLIELKKEVIEQYPEFIEAFKFFTVAGN